MSKEHASFPRSPHSAFIKSPHSARAIDPCGCNRPSSVTIRLSGISGLISGKRYYMRCGIPEYYNYILKFADMSLLNGDHTFPYYGLEGKCDPIYQYGTYYMALEEKYYGYYGQVVTAHFYCYFNVRLRLNGTLSSSAVVHLGMWWGIGGPSLKCQETGESVIRWSTIRAPLGDPCNLIGQSTAGSASESFIQPGTCTIVSMTY